MMNNGQKLLMILFFTLVLSVMNATMFNIALPMLKEEFAVPSSVVGWVLSGYIVVYAVGSVTFGKLADIFPLRKLLLFGLLFVAAGSLFGLFANAFWMVITGRILQAIGASVIPAAAMIIPVKYFPLERRGRALGVVATGLATGTAIGPVVAGFIADVLDWRLLFLLPMLMLLTIPFYHRWLTENDVRDVRFDWQGGLLLAGTVVGFLLAITNSDWRWALIGLAAGALLILQTRRSTEPFLSKSLFVNRQFRGAVLVAFATTGTIFVVPFTMPMLLSQVHGLSVAQIGLIMFPGAVVAALFGRTIGRWTDEFGSQKVFLGSALLMICAFCLLAFMYDGIIALFVFVLMMIGIGQVGLQISLSNRVSATLSKDSVGLGMGMFSMLNFISGATATTLVGKALDGIAITTYGYIFFVIAGIMLAVVLFHFFQNRSA